MKSIDFISNDLKLLIAESMSAGQCTTISDLMEMFDLTQYQATELLNDVSFLTSVSKMSKAKAKMFFHSKGIGKLIDIASSEDNKAALAAMKMVMEYTGEVQKKGGDVNVNVSLENHIREQEEKEKNITPQPVIEVGMKSIPSTVSNAVDDFDIEEISNDLKFQQSAVSFVQEFIN